MVVKEPKVRLYIRVRHADGRDVYADPAWNKNRSLRAGHALVGGQTAHHPEGVYYLRYARGGKRVWQSVGKDPDLALTAQRNVEHDLRGVALNRVPAPVAPEPKLPRPAQSEATVADAIATYMAEVRAFKSPKTIAACQHMLGQFNKEYAAKPVAQVTRKDLLDHMVFLKTQGAGDRTVYNHISRINTLLRANGMSGLLRSSDWPKYDEKDVDAYHSDELVALFAAASAEDRLLFQFFLGTGFREQEVMYTTWANVNFRDKVISVRSKPEFAFRVKDREERSVPVPDALVDELFRLRRSSTGALVFPTAAGKPDGHMLRRLQRLAFRAGLNCGECVTRSGKDCSEHPVCSVWSLHKFRRTFATMHAEAGVSPRSVDESIASVLSKAMSRLLDSRSVIEKKSVEALVAALATLRPFVPLSVLATTAGVELALVESFVADLGRPLLLSNGAVQFRDEPTETWFRQHYRATGEQLRRFARKIESLATTHAYAAATLPQLLLEAEEFDHLIELALSSGALPTDPAERRLIEVQRLRFAPAAALRSGRYLQASKLALKAGQEVSGADRHLDLLARNLDLFAALFPAQSVHELAGSHTLSGEWLGARHAYEAGLFARIEDAEGEARSQLRMANEWLYSWSGLPDDERRRAAVSEEVKAEIAEAVWRLDGPAACVAWLRRWRPRGTQYVMSKLLARRALDAGRTEAVQDLLATAAKHIEIAVGIVHALNMDGAIVKGSLVKGLLRRLASYKISEDDGFYWHRGERIEQGVNAVVEMAIRARVATIATADLLQPLLDRMQKHHFGISDRGRRSALIRAYVLQAQLRGLEATPNDMAPADVRADLAKEHYRQDHSTREYMASVTALLPWHVLHVRSLQAAIPENLLSADIDQAVSAIAKAKDSYSGRDLTVTDEVGIIWMKLLCSKSTRDETAITKLLGWARDEGNCRYIPTWTAMARTAARSELMQQEAFTCASVAAEIITSSTLDAASRADSFIDIARALLHLDHDEAKSYFNEGITVASKLGYEASHRWRSILNLADGCAGLAEGSERLTYRVARNAEFVHSYEHKHFDWEGTIRSMVTLAPATALATVSRWHDRRFGYTDRTLALTFGELQRKGLIPPQWVPALLWFRADWDYEMLLESMIEQLEPSSRSGAFTRALRPLTLERHSSNLWEAIASLATKYGLPSEVASTELATAEGAEAVSMSGEHGFSGHPSRRRATSSGFAAAWEKLKLDEDLHTVESITDALAKWRAASEPDLYLNTEAFIEQLFSHSTPGHSAEVVKAFLGVTVLDHWDISQFLRVLPQEWLAKRSVQQTLQAAAEPIARRFPLELCEKPFRERSFLELLCERCGVSAKVLTDVALNAVGHLQISDAESLFGLTSLTVHHLDARAAAEALEYGLDLLEEQVPDDVSDGPWTRDLFTNDSLPDAIGGFILAKLASPVASLRWQAAHVLHELGFASDGLEFIRRLLQKERKSHFAPYVDKRFVVYSLHARLWLFIGLARLSKSRPGLLSAEAEWFEQLATTEDHVLIRHFARDAALKAITSDPASQAARSRLTQVNTSPYEVVSGSRYDYSQREQYEPYDPNLFQFCYDMDRYWFQPLARAFGIDNAKAMHAGRTAAMKEWKGKHTGKWQDDARRQGVFDDRETWHSHGNTPKTDDLSFYLSFHALMMAAGELLRTVPVRKEAESDETFFDDWLQDHLLSLSNGTWLADRRDPEPGHLLSVHDVNDDVPWEWSVQRSDFARALVGNGTSITLHGNWTTVRGSRVERVSVNSFLVPAEKAAALKRALQSADDPYRYGFPHADDHQEIKPNGFDLNPTTQCRSGSRRLDDLDPWAGSIGPDMSALSAPFLGVLSDASQARAGEPLFCSQTWGSRRTDERSDDALSHGSRLQVSPAVVSEVLSQSRVSLIVGITIGRERPRSSHQGSLRDHHVFTPPYFYYYVFEAGSVARNDA